MFRSGVAISIRDFVKEALRAWYLNGGLRGADMLLASITRFRFMKNGTWKGRDAKRGTTKAGQTLPCIYRTYDPTIRACSPTPSCPDHLLCSRVGQQAKSTAATPPFGAPPLQGSTSVVISTSRLLTMATLLRCRWADGPRSKRKSRVTLQ